MLGESSNSRPAGGNKAALLCAPPRSHPRPAPRNRCLIELRFMNTSCLPASSGWGGLARHSGQAGGGRLGEDTLARPQRPLVLRWEPRVLSTPCGLITTWGPPC